MTELTYRYTQNLQLFTAIALNIDSYENFIIRDLSFLTVIAYLSMVGNLILMKTDAGTCTVAHSRTQCPNTKIVLYADDAKVYNVVTCDDDQKSLQRAVDKVKEWCDQWLLSLNVTKCYHGPDGFHPRVLFEIRNELLEPLEILFTASFATDSYRMIGEQRT